MCNAVFNPRLSPMTAVHALELSEVFPQEANFISDIFEAMTDHFRPQVNLLVMFAGLKHLLKNPMNGVLGDKNVRYVPLSVVAKTGDQEYSRYRPGSVGELHTSFLSFMMARRNVKKVEQVCEQHGVKLSCNHCCGVIFGTPEAVQTYEKSEDYKARCTLRSYAESMAMPVVETEEVDEVPAGNIDLGESEREFFRIYESCMQNLSLPASREKVALDTSPIFEAWSHIVSRESLPGNKKMQLNDRVGLLM